ncbi:MAG: hypothetical protein HC805_08040, partial [Alkalinema sp. RL_2_19]|nr:hypothetical protein [Alkalinema sp. RL_2_19]
MPQRYQTSQELEIAILGERLRQARHSFNMALFSATACGLAGMVGIGCGSWRGIGTIVSHLGRITYDWISTDWEATVSMNIATELDAAHAEKLTYIRSQTQQDVDEILREAIDLYYQQLQSAQK